MRAGALDQRVTLEQRVEGQDEAGQPFEDWLPVFDAWAAVEPLRGKEVIRADARGADRVPQWDVIGGVK